MQTLSSLSKAATTGVSSLLSSRKISCCRSALARSLSSSANHSGSTSRHIAHCGRTRRRFSTSGSSPEHVVFEDPHRIDLFYHLVTPPTPLSRTAPAFALSFLRQAPSTAHSAAVIGWLPAQTYKSESADPACDSSQSQESSATLQQFVGNPKFVSFLQETLRSGLSQGVDGIWRDAALQIQSGWMHIHDQRNPPDQGRIGDPDDIIASVLVTDSEIQPETYQPMPSYRVCTSDGVLQLTPGLADYLRQALLRLTEG